MPLDPTRMHELLQSLAGRRVLVLGDVMLDRYESGEAVKLSPEAPVPVLKKVEQRDVAGGAANVAMNVCSLGGAASLIGVAADDDEGDVLRGILDGRGVLHDLLQESGRPTTLKTRFTHKGQQFLRLDREDTHDLADGTMQAVLRAFDELLPGSDCVMCSDYAKGFFSAELAAEIAQRAWRAGVPLVVDPKPSNPYLCERCFLFMPNRAEGTRLAGLPAEHEAHGGDIASSLCERYDTNVLLTDGRNGMYLARPGSDVAHIKSKASEVFDVSGAGDTAAAAVALAVGARVDLFEAAALANRAAGVAVSKLGTATVAAAEVAESLSGGPKVLDWQRAAEVVGELKRSGKRVVFTNGCFDLLHVGHINYLKAARALGGALVVGVNSDESVRRLKGPDRPLIGERQRSELLAALEPVDYVVVFGQDTPIELIELLRPDVFVKGGDYTEERLPEAPVVRGYGGTVEIVELFGDGISTSQIIEKIAGAGEGDE